MSFIYSSIVFNMDSVVKYSLMDLSADIDNDCHLFPVLNTEK